MNWLSYFGVEDKEENVKRRLISVAVSEAELSISDAQVVAKEDRLQARYQRIEADFLKKELQLEKDHGEKVMMLTQKRMDKAKEIEKSLSEKRTELAVLEEKIKYLTETIAEKVQLAEKTVDLINQSCDKIVAVHDKRASDAVATLSEMIKALPGLVKEQNITVEGK